MLKRFVAVREDEPGEDWARRFAAGRKEAERWYLGEKRLPPPSPEECRAALARYMPEFLDRYDRACRLVGHDPMAHRIISQYRPAPMPSGCSQAVWLGPGGPALVRNYDWHPDGVPGRVQLSNWLVPVIAQAQRPWGGCLDGMNAHGLVVSLTFGGRMAGGRGFAVILILRYVLETCRDVRGAIDAFGRIPIALTHNVTLLDRTGDFATLFLGPDREMAVTDLRVCTNHQERQTPAASVRRQDALRAALAEPAITLPSLVDRFLETPLRSRRLAFATVYTAVYRPAELSVDYVWPGKTWRQSLRAFVPGEYAHDYGPLEI